ERRSARRVDAARHRARTRHLASPRPAPRRRSACRQSARQGFDVHTLAADPSGGSRADDGNAGESGRSGAVNAVVRLRPAQSFLRKIDASFDARPRFSSSAGALEALQNSLANVSTSPNRLLGSLLNPRITTASTAA